MKNYFIKFIGNQEVMKLTAEEAAKLVQAWVGGASVLIIRGRAYASHQICSITPLPIQEEKDLCEVNGITFKDAPRIENFLSNKKLLT